MANESDDDKVNELGYFSQRQMEKIFVWGFNKKDGKLHEAHEVHEEHGDDHDEVSQNELIKISKEILKDLAGSKGARALTDKEINDAKAIGGKLYHWYRKHDGPHLTERGLRITFGHLDKIVPVGGGDGFFDCNLLTDEWFKWFLTTPRPRNPYSRLGEGNRGESELYGEENAFQMQKRGTAVYFTTASPFQVPADVKTITLTTNAPLLVPVYNVYASREMFPSLNNDEDLQVEVISDLLGIKPETIKAKIDGQTIEPCCVIRKKPLRIDNIPDDNVAGIPKDRLNESGRALNIFHGGFWMLITPETLGAGDHLLEWRVDSANYKIDVQMPINALV